MNLIKISAILSIFCVLSRNLLEDNMKDLCSVYVIPPADTTFLHILHRSQADNDTNSYLHHVVFLLPPSVLPVSQKIQRKGQSARKVRETCEMKRYHGTGGKASH